MGVCGEKCRLGYLLKCYADSSALPPSDGGRGEGLMTLVKPIPLHLGYVRLVRLRLCYQYPTPASSGYCICTGKTTSADILYRSYPSPKFILPVFLTRKPRLRLSSHLASSFPSPVHTRTGALTIRGERFFYPQIPRLIEFDTNPLSPIRHWRRDVLVFSGHWSEVASLLPSAIEAFSPIPSSKLPLVSNGHWSEVVFLCSSTIVASA